MDRLGIFFITLFLLSTISQAKTYSSKFIKFELPPLWECVFQIIKKQPGWTCQNIKKDKQKEAIILFLAKRRGLEGTLPQHLAYLKKKKIFAPPVAYLPVSQPKYALYKTIKKHKWVDALHLGSEVPGYYTRYLTTIKGKLEIAMTLSCMQDHYDNYRKIFDNIVKTLEVFKVDDLLNSKIHVQNNTKEELFDGDTFIGNDLDRFGINVNQKKRAAAGKMDGNMTLYIILGVVGLFIFIIIKKKKK